ncbi:tRNA pseudouridine synthase B [Scardovia inopinata]|uniref:tRNA pseudouridine synthase B n=2 Tax=Scardovia inopinata TaxID=78259 RepID=W5IIF3_SCAIO|nr:tRNA pseudouridine(55) synthase TruB [Scardovia inopinata]EFG26652.2 tRNA pseudouridine synthase B [Scardovia inopinata F0304]SUV51768.1 tRNA pseudouridine synthase B [Scardovia inopinata]
MMPTAPLRLKNKSGILLVDKPQGVTSHDVVAAARSLLGTRHVGHAGTLDPMATGLLILGYGKATRLLSLITRADKTYQTVIRLGQATTTDDAEGSVVSQGPVSSLTDRIIQEASSRLTGTIDQVPSSYSAIKVRGQRAYDLARQGREVQLASRKVTISDFTIHDIRPGQTDSVPAWPVIDVAATITCSSGTYIRALGRDLGKILGCGAHLTMLRRTRIGKFSLDQGALTASTTVRTFTRRTGEKVCRPRVVFDPCLPDGPYFYSPAQAAALTLPWITLSADQVEAVRHGRILPLPVTGLTAALAAYDPAHDSSRDSSHDLRLVALLEPWQGNQAKPRTVFMEPEG